MLSNQTDRTIEINLKNIEKSDCKSINISERIRQLKANNYFDRLHTDELNYENFFINYLLPNVPVIITGISQKWECTNWIRKGQEENNKCDIDFSYLMHKFGECTKVPVANCQVEYFNSHKKIELPFSEFIDYWRNRVEIGGDASHIECDKSNNLLYLKDWHLRRELPKYEFYQTPIYFASDWLNEYCENRGIDDYRFVYMGPKGTWTPYHVDVFSSFSWSTNIAGSKKWLFLLPGEEIKLETNHTDKPFTIDANMLRLNGVEFIEIIQNAGETVFVPSGWYHQVWNLADTISVNHNWFNACNISTIWSEMYTSFELVVKEISDCKDMDNFDSHCQLMLRNVFGMNFDMLIDLLDVVVDNRIRVLTANTEAAIVNDVLIGKGHATYDLRVVVQILDDMKKKCSDLLRQEKFETIIQKLRGGNLALV